METTISQARILVVDDDETNRRLMTTQLNLVGFKNLMLAENGQDALRLFKEYDPDIVLLDVMMPDINGFIVTETIREEYPNKFVPIMLITALQDVDQHIKGLHSGANDVIAKPYNTEELLARINSLLQLKHARDALVTERERLALLYDISQALTAHLNIDDLMSKIVAMTTELTGASKATLVLLDSSGTFQRRIVAHRGDEVPRTVSRINEEVIREGLLGWVIQNARPVYIPDVTQDERWTVLSDEDEETGSVVSVPINMENQVNGALLLESPDAGALSLDHLDLLIVIAAKAAIALENARLFDESRTQTRRVEALLNQIGDPVIVTNDSGIITQMNPASIEVLPIDESHLNQSLESVFSLALADLLYRAQERSSSVSGEYTVREDGERTSFNVSISPIEDIGYILLWQNITGIKESERVRLQTERAETERVKQTFSRYMSPALVERVLGDRAIMHRKERREAIVMFADLRGFTRLTVEHDPTQVMNLLNDVFSEMMEIVYEHEGVIFDIAGDELMIAFNVPYEQEDAKFRALSTAIKMQKRFGEIRHNWVDQGMEVGMGIGINHGPVVLGHVGGRSRMNYAMVGETVNIAHRLVDVAENAQIIIAPGLLDPFVEEMDDVNIVELPPQTFKGKSEPMSVIQLQLAL